MVEFETRQESERAYARGRADASSEQQQRNRPRLGGTAGLPASGATADLFLVSADDLSKEERGAAGWCVRLGVPDAIPTTGGDFDLHELVVELTVTVGGTAYAIEVNAFPGAVVHLVGDQLSARVKWGITPVNVPPGVNLVWQVARGKCETKAVRAYTVQAPTELIVPSFATGFALFSGAADITEDIQINFATHIGSTRVIQHFTKTDLQQVIAAFSPVPPGSGSWRWLTATAAPVRLAFNLGGLSW